MPKKLNQQPFCGWCGAKVTYPSEWMSQCPGCGFKNYINLRPCNSVIITLDDAVLMVKRAVQPMQGKFDMPGGYMDMTDASMEQAAYREIEEELGLDEKDISELAYIGSGTTPYQWQGCLLDNVAFYYTAELRDEKRIQLNPSENTEYIWVTAVDIPHIDFAWDIDRRMLHKYFKEHAQ